MPKIMVTYSCIYLISDSKSIICILKLISKRYNDHQAGDDHCIFLISDTK